MPHLLEWATGHWALLSVVAFLGFAAIETVRPDRRPRPDATGRWITHLGIYAADLVLGSTILPWIVLALIADASGPYPTRLFAVLDSRAGSWAVLAVGLVMIDLLIYWAHRLQHRFHVLWRFHAVHHADTEVDVSTALLHHPLAYLGVACGIGLVMHGLGMPAWVFPVYGLFEITFGAFQHVATPVPDRFERAVRWLLVTPGMHQVHHSAEPAHFDSNFANVLSVWDRLFRTYRVLDAAARDRIRFGVDPDGSPAPRGPLQVLAMPFRMRRPGATLDAALGEARAP